MDRFGGSPWLTRLPRDLDETLWLPEAAAGEDERVVII